jgi:hypothetical protein
MRARQLRLARASDSIEIPMPSQQLAGDLEDITRLRARPQDDGDELFV